MHRYWLLAMGLSMAACMPKETVTQYGGADYIWQLREMDNAAVAFDATIRLDMAGKLYGTGPCNSFSATQDAPYPWVAIRVDMVSRAYCEDMAQERAFLARLEQMSLVEVSGPNLVLSNDDGQEMVFTGLPGAAQNDP